MRLKTKGEKKLFKDIYKRKDLSKIETITGEPIRVKRGWIYEDGDLVYKEKGLTNVYEEIQAQAEMTDLHAIMNRYENGDATALNKVQGMYIDAVELPKNYAQLYDAVSKADMVFDTLPAEIKMQFNNNAAEFWKNYGQEEFDHIVNKYREDTLSRYGLADENPIETSKNSAEASEPIIITDPVKPIKESANNEQKSE